MEEPAACSVGEFSHRILGELHGISTVLLYLSLILPRVSSLAVIEPMYRPRASIALMVTLACTARSITSYSGFGASSSIGKETVGNQKKRALSRKRSHSAHNLSEVCVGDQNVLLAKVQCMHGRRISEPLGQVFRSLGTTNSHYLSYDVLECRRVALVFDEIRLIVVNVWTVGCVSLAACPLVSGP